LFEAPESGYAQSDEIVVSSGAENWQPSLNRNYFLKMRDGSYARAEIGAETGVPQTRGIFNYVTVDAYLNPKIGSRNLEFDPAKVIQSP